jgi:hypothetical protein
MAVKYENEWKNQSFKEILKKSGTMFLEYGRKSK